MIDQKRRSTDPVRDIPEYLRLFYSHVGGRFYLVFLLAILGSIAEGVGIMMLLPLLGTMDGVDSSALGGIGDAMNRGLEFLGLAGSTVAILIFILVFFTLKGVFLFLAQAYTAWLHVQLTRKLRVGLYDAFSHMRLQYYVGRHTGHFVNVITAQVLGFASTFQAMVHLGKALVMALVYVGLATAITWTFGVMALVLGVVFIAAFRNLNIYVRKLSIRNSAEASVHTKLLVQALQSFKYLASSGVGHRVRRGVVTTLERILGRNLRISLANAFTHSAREPFAVMALVGLVGVQMVWLGEPVGPILIAIILFHRALGSVAGVQSSWQQVLSGVGSVELVRDEINNQEREREVDGAVDIGPLNRGIELRNVHFAYGEEQDEVLAGLTLKIPAKTTVAIVGESGAGKSTLVDILTLMLKPRRGQVLIDGVPAETIRLASWRSQIGFVSQESVIFDDTIANNICLWEGEIDTDPDLYAGVREAARQAHLHHVVEALPAKYHTVVGDRGVRLSGGQRQRLFVARELFKQPGLLILDEATSALDSESERAIQESIEALKGKLTVVIVAHRLATIRHADEIFVIDQGRLVEKGDFTSLQQDAGSRFARLVSLQRL